VTESQSALGSELAKKAVRLALTVVGLLVLRAILAALPVLKNASAFDDSLISPLVVGNAIVDTAIFLALLGFGIGLGRSVQAAHPRLPELGKILTLAVVAVVLLLAYQSYQMPAACLVETPADLLNLNKASTNVNSGNPEFGELLRAWNQMVQGFSAEALPTATGSNLLAYQRLAVAVFRQSPDLYGWTFLVLVAIPVVSIVLMITRNLDAFTELVFHAATVFQAPGHAASPAQTPVARGPGGEVVDGTKTPGSVVNRLAKLKSLLDSGLISAEDFGVQKTAILQHSPAVTEAGELRQLKSMLDAGALTQEEYDTQKRRFLSQL
jgi:hypothetical protein